ncbi:MAG: type IV pilus secretin PilQ [Candidatus Omnitrophica bacterium]|nr:type IV pilus secretin PilQ [Candidatus Omnitrophota bacterium]
MVRALCFVLLAMMLGCPAGYAQDPAGAALVPAEQAASYGSTLDTSAVAPALEVKPAGSSSLSGAVTTPAVVPEAVMEFKMTKGGNVSLDFREADIKNVLKVLSYKSGVNIIAGPEVVGMVNIQLKEVPWQKALDVILSTYGYSYEQKGTIIMVTTVENLKKRREDSKLLTEQEPMATETFVLNFSKAEDVAKSLDKMKTARGNVNFDARTNSIIVSDVGSNLELIKEVVKKLDTVTPQILIDARIIETELNNQETLGIQWPTSIGGTATMPVRRHIFPWSTARDSSYLPATSFTNPLKVGDQTVAGPTGDTLETQFTYGTISLNSLTVVLDMLKQRVNTNSLSNPRIVTLDNQSANIAVGRKYPLPKYTYSDTQDKLTISGWEYIEYGLTFKVTPHINGRDLVTLDIEPVVVSESGSVGFNFGSGQTTNVPILRTESAKTNVMIRDGETLVIAGLISDTKSNTVRKVPVLGDIPLLGALFRHKADLITKTELMIFLTPRIITSAMTMGVLPVVPVVAAAVDKK